MPFSIIRRYISRISDRRHQSKIESAFRKLKSTLSNTMSENVHETAKSGFVDGDNYDQFRTSYTDEVVKIIASIITADSQMDKDDGLQYDCVELGAGTGKLTKKLLEELPEHSCTFYACGEEARRNKAITKVNIFIECQKYYKHQTKACQRLINIIDGMNQKLISQDNKNKFDFPDDEDLLVVLFSRSRYLATEPMDGFLQTLKKNCPGLTNTKICSADNISVQTGKVKNVLAAQCFHWFANTASINEIHRILKPSGKFIMVWNNKDQKVPWIKDMGDILTRYYSDTPRFFSGKWKIFLESCPQFQCVRHDVLPGFCQQWHYEDVIGHYCSISVIASLDKDEKELVKEEMKAVMDKHRVISDGGEVVVPFYTELYITEKVK